MELLMIMTYTGLCWAVFKIFRVPVNKWSIPTAILGGFAMIGAVLLVMNYNHPYSTLVRDYYVTTPIVPNVKGIVVDVPVEPNTLLAAGEVLFRIDPKPYEFEVQRLEAALADATSTVQQIAEQLSAAQAASAEARSNVQASSSEYERQAREALEQARAVVAQTTAQLELARTQEERYRDLLAKGSVSKQDYDRALRNYESLLAQMRQAEAAERQSAEKLVSGSDRLQLAREQLRQSEAQEREVELAYKSEIGGVNPRVQQIRSQLDNARWELEQTTVRAPTAGIVTQLLLRPGMMAASLPLRPVMTFIHAQDAKDRVLVGAFWQNSLQRIEAGNEAEVIFKAVPGHTFKAKVDRILPVLSQGQTQTSGTLTSVEAVPTPGKVPVVLQLEEDLSHYHLPMGVIGAGAIYTEHVHHVALLRKILLRMVSWQNYIFGELH